MSKSEKSIPWGPKLRFFTGHLVLSVAVFLALLLLIWNIWYPRPFFWTDGGSEGLGTVAFVDIIIGPFLSLVIFNPSKSRKELFMDIGIVVVLQITALIYGVLTVYDGRPMVLVHTDRAFKVVDMSPFEVQKVKVSDFEKFGDELPPPVHTRSPEGHEVGEFLENMMMHGLTADMQFKFYESMYDHLDTILHGSLDMETGMKDRKNLARHVNKKVSRLGGSVADYYYFAYIGRFRNGILMLDDKGKRVGFLFHEPGGIPYINPPKPKEEKPVPEGETVQEIVPPEESPAEGEPAEQNNEQKESDQ